MGVSDLTAAVAFSRAKRQATALVLVVASLCFAGCLQQRKANCVEFRELADECYVSAGIEPFFEENVDCTKPASSLGEYTCLVTEYTAARDDGACFGVLEAYETVDAASLACFGWDGDLVGDLADDDDSAR